MAKISPLLSNEQEPKREKHREGQIGILEFFFFVEFFSILNFFCQTIRCPEWARAHTKARL